MENQLGGRGGTGRRKGLKISGAPRETLDNSVNIDGLGTGENRIVPPGLETAEINRRLLAALNEAGRSALGLPGTVFTFKDMLDRAGLALVLHGDER